jgi:cytochrome c oxidase subunit II
LTWYVYCSISATLVRLTLAKSITVIVASLVAAASVYGLPQTPGAEPETKTFEVVARRFAFEPDTIEVNEGDRVRLLVRSADGPPVTIEFVASTAGTFPILCSEYCGSGHKDMTGTLVVHIKSRGVE